MRDLIVDTATFMLYPPRNSEVAITVIGSLFIILLTSERELCASLNQDFAAGYSGYIFEEFQGSYGDFFVHCCRDLLPEKFICKPFDILLSLCLYNMYVLILI